MVKRAISPRFYIDPDLGDQIYREEKEIKVYDLDIETKIDIYMPTDLMGGSLI